MVAARRRHRQQAKMRIIPSDTLRILSLSLALAALSSAWRGHGEEAPEKLVVVPEATKEHETADRMGQCLEAVGESLTARSRWPWALNQRPVGTANQRHRFWVNYDFVMLNCLVELYASNGNFTGRDEQIDLLSLTNELADRIGKNLAKIQIKLDEFDDEFRKVAAGIGSMRNQLKLRSSARQLKRQRQTLSELLVSSKSSVGRVQAEIDAAMQTCLSLAAQSLDDDPSRDHGELGHAPSFRAVAMEIVSRCKQRLRGGDIGGRVEELCKEVRAQVTLQKLAELGPFSMGPSKEDQNDKVE